MDAIFDIRNYDDDLPPAKRPKTTRSNPTRARNPAKASNPTSRPALTNGKRSANQIPKPSKKIAKLSPSKSSDEPLAVQYKPNSKADLCIDKKKLQLIDDWFQSVFVEKDPEKVKQSNRVLVLYGQSGCAKTTTIQVLAKHYDVTLHEFEELQQNFYQDVGERAEHLQYERYIGNQMDQLQSFVNGVNSCMSKKDRERRKAIVLKELPSTCYSDVKRLHEFLQNYLKLFRRRAPIIFIVTMNENMSVNDFKKLFPPELHQQLSMLQIELNGVVKRQIKAVLDRINTAGLVSKGDIDLLVEASEGDLRAAINALEFIVQSDGNREQSFEIRESDAVESHNVMAIKDTSPGFFRMIGKIMYCKRDGDEAKKRNVRGLAADAKVNGDRRQLKECPEDLADHLDCNGDTLVAFVHDYYPDFVDNDLESAAEIVSNLCIADSHFADGWQFQEMDEFMKLTAIRGTMYHLNTKSEPSKAKRQFRSFTRPKQYTMREKEQQFQHRITERGKQRGYQFKSNDELYEVLSFRDRDLFSNLF